MKNFIVIGFLVLMTILTTHITIPTPTIDSTAGASRSTVHVIQQQPSTSNTTIDGTASPSLNNNAIIDGVIATDIVIDSVAAASTKLYGSSSTASGSTTTYYSDAEYEEDEHEHEDHDEWEHEEEDD